jgi:hypothetical protein
VRNAFEAILFIFVVSPLDVGESILLENEKYTVSALSDHFNLVPHGP